MIGVFTLITEALVVSLLVPLHTTVFSNIPLCSVNLAATSVVNPGTRTIDTISEYTHTDIKNWRSVDIFDIYFNKS
ncbi:hypothetical protein EDD85DRAFT_211165 [Armillaria nabsnona]|nr:hypothetical protein EDD85DRAFT_211165 [Armillaria nabsnona]